MRIRNLRNTSNHNCNCASWLAHWGRFSGQSLSHSTKCCVYGCEAKAEVGAHVEQVLLWNDPFNQPAGGLSGILGIPGWKIVPMCIRHNHQEGEFDIDASTALAPASRYETCGKSSRYGLNGLRGLLQD